MKKIFKTVAMAVLTIAMTAGFSSCNNDDLGQAPGSVETRVIIPHNTVISANTTWSSADEYILNGKVYVKAPATLTIQPGTVIKGVYNSDPEQASALIVTRGAKINANGNATNPIIFTAQNGLKGGWGGIVLLGKAPINQPDQLIEGINPSVVPSGVDVYYGGGGAGLGDCDDNSGTLRYVRVEYAGAAISDANELNAFTFGGVGKGTTLEYLQAYYGADDAFEFFGGCVDARYLVSTATDDDAFDFDFGYKGRIQFAVSTIDPSVSYSSDPNGIECDNQGGNGPWPATPKTHPQLSNFTIVGTQSGTVAGGGIGTQHQLKSGANFRRGTEFTLVNSIVYGFPTGVLLENINPIPSPSSELKGVVISSVNPGSMVVGLTSAVATLCLSYVDTTGIVLTAPWGQFYTTNALKPTGGPALDSCIHPHTDTWFTQTTYKGAFASGLGNTWLLAGVNQGWILPQKNYSN
jgi:hypothetical protein